TDPGDGVGAAMKDLRHRSKGWRDTYCVNEVADESIGPERWAGPADEVVRTVEQLIHNRTSEGEWARTAAGSTGSAATRTTPANGGPRGARRRSRRRRVRPGGRCRTRPARGRRI